MGTIERTGMEGYREQGLLMAEHLGGFVSQRIL